MAKRVCPFCKEKVKINATICKHCRSELPPLPPKKWYKKWWSILFILFGLGILANIATQQQSQVTKPTSETEQKPKKTDAETLAESDEWKEYYRDSNSVYSYRNIKKLADSKREVMTVMEIRNACAYNHYRINCKTKQWFQIESAGVPCRRSFTWNSGQQKWNNLDKTDIFYNEKKKLMGIVCGEK